MSIIIDTNCLCSVFSEKDEKHDIYQPILSLLRTKRAKMLIGGTTYKDELKKIRHLTSILTVLKTHFSAIVNIKDSVVDDEELRIRRLIPDIDFDDPHIAALVAASGCKIICTRDTRSIPYLKRKEIYPRGISVPKFYTRPQNESLFNPKNLNKNIKNRVQ